MTTGEALILAVFIVVVVAIVVIAAMGVEMTYRVMRGVNISPMKNHDGTELKFDDCIVRHEGEQIPNTEGYRWIYGPEHLTLSGHTVETGSAYEVGCTKEKRIVIYGQLCAPAPDSQGVVKVVFVAVTATESELAEKLAWLKAQRENDPRHPLPNMVQSLA